MSKIELSDRNYATHIWRLLRATKRTQFKSIKMVEYTMSGRYLPPMEYKH